jgi:hypothetical protein
MQFPAHEHIDRNSILFFASPLSQFITLLPLQAYLAKYTQTFHLYELRMEPATFMVPVDKLHQIMELLQASAPTWNGTPINFYEANTYFSQSYTETTPTRHINFRLKLQDKFTMEPGRVSFINQNIIHTTKSLSSCVELELLLIQDQYLETYYWMQHKDAPPGVSGVPHSSRKLNKEEAIRVLEMMSTLTTSTLAQTRLRGIFRDVVQFRMTTLSDLLNSRVPINYPDSLVMWRYYLFDSDSLQIRLHLFPSAAETYIHNHKTNFISMALHGKYTHSTWNIQAYKEEKHYERNRNSDGTLTDAILSNGKIELTNQFQHVTGNVYFLSSSCYHVVHVESQEGIAKSRDPSKATFVSIFVKDKSPNSIPTKILIPLTEESGEVPMGNGKEVLVEGNAAVAVVKAIQSKISTYHVPLEFNNVHGNEH